MTLIVLCAALPLVAVPRKVNYPTNPRVEMVTIATGEVVPVVYKGAVPEPAQSPLAYCRRAGLELTREEGGIRVNWIFEVGPKGRPDSLSSVTSVVIDEVSGAAVVPMFEGKGELVEGRIQVFVPRELLSAQRYPWLYADSATPFIFRVQLLREGKDPSVLIQPVVVDAVTKGKLKSAGYLP